VSEAAPLVSCVIATGDRPALLAQAVRCFRRQRYPSKELVIVDDSRGGPAVDWTSPDDDILHVATAAPTVLGAKLNMAAASSSGSIIQKLDDDDYYHPEFLGTLADALLASAEPRAVAGLDCFVVYIASTGELRTSGHGWFAGGSLCFTRNLWEQRGFREVRRAVDWYFLRDNDCHRVRVCRPELYVVVRHGYGHTWRRMGEVDVTEYFRGRSPWPGDLAALLPASDIPFYRSLGDSAP
jgi:glycosyltransferase involved in cell wall biosynthesis